MAFSPDGTTLAAVGFDRKVWLWNLADPAHPDRLTPLTGPVTPVDSVAFSPDRKTLAASSDDGEVWLWNVADPAQPVPLGQPLTGSATAVNSVAFSPDGRILAGGSYDRTTDLWDLSVDDAIQRICASTFNVLTPQLWNQYISHVANLPYAPPCDHLTRNGLLAP